MTPHTIYFVRHGETVWNTERRLQGRMDSPLTERGREHARANAQTLIEAVPHVRALPFVASPLGRTRATMEIIREHLGLPVHGYEVDERLAELAFGAWEGLTLPEIRSTQAGQWSLYEASKWTHVPAGGESYESVGVRLKHWLEGLEGETVVVAHGAVGRVLRGLNVGLPHHEIPFANTPEHDRVYRLANGSEAAL